jgi:CRISPR/Cas system-associated exonuclease Cas4 (RecB family)
MFIHNPPPLVEEIDTVTVGGKRYYATPEGNRYPSITTVLSILSRDSIMQWRKKVGEQEANRISTQAARRGTNVHKMCEDYLNNNFDIKRFNPTDRETFKSLQPILDQNINNIHAQEIALWSDYLGVAGRCDCIAEWGGKLSVIDFKTSRKLKKKEYIGSYFQQASAYAVMYEERTKIPINQIVILIAVDNEEPQVFIEKRDNYIWQCVDTIKAYYDENGL